MNSLFENLTEYLLGQSVHIVWLFILVGVVCLSLRNKSAHLRYLLWLLIIVKCLIPSLVTISLAILPEKAEPVVEQVIYEEAVEPEVFINVATEYVPMVESPVDTRPAFIQYITALSKEELLAFGWMAGAGMFLVVIFAKAMRTNMILTKNRRALPDSLQAEVSELLGGQSGAGPKCYCMDGIAQPFVWGLVRGSIYLPADFMASTDGEHRRQILMHEMAHITRRDPVVNFLQIIAQVVFFFHPLVWAANKLIRAEREKCCDEAAIARLDASPKDYGRAIVDVLVNEYESTMPTPSMAIAGPVKNIENRIKTIMQPGRKFYKRPTVIALLMILLFAAVTVPVGCALSNREAKNLSSQIDKDASENSEVSGFKKTLPNGVTVELVGICEYPSEGKQWWSPDGSKIAQRPYDKVDDNFEFGVGIQDNDYEFAFRIANLPDPGFGWRLESDGIDLRTLAKVFNNGQVVSDLRTIAARFQDSEKKKDLRLGIASVPRRILSRREIELKGIFTSGIIPGGITWNRPSEPEKGVTAVTVVTKDTESDIRIVAVGKDGKIIVGGSSDSHRDESVVMINAEFDAPISEIKEFQYRSRPYEWIEFKNVSLKPNFKTGVEVERDKARNIGQKAEVEQAYSDMAYIIPAQVPPDELKNREADYFNLIEGHVQGMSVENNYMQFLRTVLQYGGDIYYYYDEKAEVGKAVFLRQNYWEREHTISKTELPAISLDKLPLEKTIGTLDGRKYKIRFIDWKAQRPATMVGPLRGRAEDLSKQCLIQFKCVNDASFILPPLVQSNFKSVIDHILTNKQNRVYEGLYAAVSNGDEIMAYCHYKDPLATTAFGVEKLAKILRLKRVDENKWQIKEAKVVWYTQAESVYLRTHPDAELWRKSAVEFEGNGVIDAAKWSEGKAIMGSISSAIRAWVARTYADGSWTQDELTLEKLRFIKPDLRGTYFRAENFSWRVSFDKANTKLTFTITATAGKGITAPASVTLDETGKWTEHEKSAVEVEGLQLRAESMKKLKVLGAAMHIYLSEHDGMYPVYLNEAFAKSVDIYYDDWLANDVKLLVPGEKEKPGQMVIAYDNALLEKQGGTNVLFSDGHVEFRKRDQLEGIINNPEQILDKKIDFSTLTTDTGFGDAINLMRNSSTPPLPIVVLWADLDENAFIGKDEPIRVDGLGIMKLSAGLRAILRSLSNVAQLGFVVEDGIITIGTSETLQKDDVLLRKAGTHLPVNLPGGFGGIDPENPLSFRLGKDPTEGKTQIVIETRILLVDENFLEDIGMDIDVRAKAEGKPPLDPALVGVAGKPLGRSLDDQEVKLMIRATQMHANSKTLTAPKIVVLDKEKGRISVVKEQSYISGYKESDQLGGEPEAVTETFTTGIDIEISPTITEDGKYVDMKIDFKMSDILGRLELKYKDKYPYEQLETETTEIKSRIMVPDRGTVCLGGLRVTRVKEVETGVPILSKIPILGRFFSSRSEVKDRQVLLMLVKPTIIKGATLQANPAPLVEVD